MTLIAATLTAFLASLIGSRMVVALGVLDAPTSVRKVHAAPTPTSGGIAIGVAIAIAIAVACAPPLRDWAYALSPGDIARLGLCLATAFVLLLIGVVDDLRPLSARPKFSLMALIAWLYAAFVAHAQGFALTAHVGVDFGWALGIAGSALFFFTLVNTVNFMDGANGLAIGSTAIGTAGLGVICAVHGAPHLGLACAIAAAAMAGFLVWNFPAGRLFAGDAGSLFVGGLAAGLSLIAVQDAGISIFIPPILFFPMLADVLLTLAWRVGQRRPLMKAHRDHLFQIGLRAKLTHRRVTLTYWLLAIHCALVAFLASYGPRIAIGGEGQMADAPLAFQLAAWAAAAAPIVAWAVLALVAIKVSAHVRAYARRVGLDGE